MGKPWISAALSIGAPARRLPHQSVAGSHANRKARTHELGADSRRRSWRRRSDRFERRAPSSDQIEREMTRGDIVPNTIPAVGVSVCRRRSWLAAGSRSTVIAIRHLRSLLSHSPSRPRYRSMASARKLSVLLWRSQKASARRSASLFRGRTRPGFQPKLECRSHHPVQLDQ
jgi:hypothetical protein